MRYNFLVVFLLCLLIVGTAVYAGDLLPGEEPQPTIIKVWQGNTPIGDAFSAQTKSFESILKEATDTAMKAEKYPYRIANSEIIIEKYRCDEKMQICGYWIRATRDGREVATNSPIWISPPPYEVFVSSSFDAKAFASTVILKEDPKGAVEQVLQRYVSGQPLGKAITGTPA